MRNNHLDKIDETMNTIQNNLAFRPYQEDDFQAASLLALAAWPQEARHLSNGDPLKLMGAYVEASRLAATWEEMACEEDKPVGLLFAKGVGEENHERQLGADLASIQLFWGLMTGRFGKLRSPFAFLFDTIRTERRVVRGLADADAVIELFAVDEAYRRRGIGNKLMDHFLNAASDAGVRRVAVHTDPFSTLAFYESAGFHLIDRFPDPLNSRAAGRPVESYIYALDF